MADSMHTRSDIFASVGVILVFAAVKMGYPLADPVIAPLICVLIILTGLQIIKDSSKALLDKAPLEESVIADLSRSVEGVCSCHAVRTRGMAGEIYVDLHIGVDSSLSIDSAHKVSEDVEEMIKSNIPEVRDVMVHLEPKDYCEPNGRKALD
jgi:cation diffusion facilitator family transporter